MRKLAATLVLFVFFLSSEAQQKQIDSLKKLIVTAKDDTSRIIMTSQLSQLYVYSKPDSALLLAQQGLQMAKSAQFPKGEVYCLIDISGVFSITGNYPRALSTSLEALKTSEKINDLTLIERSFHDIGFAYNNVRDYKQALNYTLKAKAVAEANHMTKSLAVDLLNVGDIYGNLNMPDLALKYTQQSYRTSAKLGDIDLIGSAWNNMGNIYSNMHQLDTAMLCYRKSILFLRRSADDDGICESTLGIARIFKQLGLKDSSLYYARQSIASGWHGGFTPRVLNASQFLTGYFKQLGQLDSAYHYLEISVTAKDSLFSQEKAREIQNLSFTERQRQIDIREKEAAYIARIRFYLLMAVIVFLLVIAIVFWRNNKQNKKAKTQIQLTLNELKTTQNQLVQSAKMASLGELTAGIAHEIQNPLNFVNNFSEVNEEMIGELEKELLAGNVEEALAITADLKQNENKIRHHGKRADFIVKGMLEHSRSSTGERQLTNINVLADEFLKLAYHGFRAKDKDFNSELVTDFDISLPRLNIVQQDIGRVLINIFNNAFYAVNQKTKTAGADYKPLVSVTTSSENGNVIIKIKDFGNGIPNSIKDKIMQPFFTTKPTGDGTGLGLSLSYDIVVKGHGGSIIVDTKEGEFTEFMVTLPF
ncbi:MAG TPA: ATP-binding protein [Mucilaginibacter sp.]|jgi:signal transduction histidine kinase|nr:ATP-binding protein [Mucilaginibacter sp.]